MTAEELLVERFLENERNLAHAKELIEDLQDDVDAANEEIRGYEVLVSVLSKYLKVTEYGVSIELKNYIADDKRDIDFLANYFEVYFDDEEETEKGEE